MLVDAYQFDIAALVHLDESDHSMPGVSIGVHAYEPTAPLLPAPFRIAPMEKRLREGKAEFITRRPAALEHDPRWVRPTNSEDENGYVPTYFYKMHSGGVFSLPSAEGPF